MDAKQYQESACRGQYSIQREISHVIRNEHPIAWRKLIGDAETREKLRASLRENTQEWCDYRAGTCYCEAKAPPTNPDVIREVARTANELFPV